MTVLPAVPVKKAAERILSVARSFGLPSLLLVIVAVTHIGYEPISGLYADQAAAARSWASVLRAFPEATLLYMAVWTLIPWQPISVRYAGSLVCAWGALESFQIAACRLQFPMGAVPPSVKPYTGLCDVVTGWPIYMLTICVVLLVTFLTKPKKKATQ